MHLAILLVAAVAASNQYGPGHGGQPSQPSQPSQYPPSYPYPQPAPLPYPLPYGDEGQGVPRCRNCRRVRAFKDDATLAYGTVLIKEKRSLGRCTVSIVTCKGEEGQTVTLIDEKKRTLAQGSHIRHKISCMGGKRWKTKNVDDEKIVFTKLACVVNPVATTVGPSTTVELATSKEPTTTKEQPLTTNEQPTTINEQPTTTNEQPTTTNEQPTTINEQPTTTNEQPTTTTAQPMTTNEQPMTTTTEQPTTTTTAEPNTTSPLSSACGTCAEESVETVYDPVKYPDFTHLYNSSAVMSTTAEGCLKRTFTCGVRDPANPPSTITLSFYPELNPGINAPTTSTTHGDVAELPSADLVCDETGQWADQNVNWGFPADTIYPTKAFCTDN